ncbi:MAG: LamG domain-containing protein, partial [Planctomycetota bacterium]
DASLVSPSATDLSGSPRVVRNPGETSTGGVPDGVGGRIDLGAYELQSDCDGDGMPDGVQLSEPFPGSGGRLRLDGLDDHALVAGFQGVPAGASTVEFWAATPAWSAQSAFAWRDCATDRVVGAMLPAPGGDVEWTSGDPSIDQSATLRHTASTYQRREGAWNHWAFVRDPATDTMRIYRNGRVVEVRSGTGMFDAGPTPLTIGAGAELFSGCATMPFRGMIDEFRVWGVARTGAEICRRCHRRSRAMRAV